MMIPGYATAEGTSRFHDRFAERLPGHFRQADGLFLSSIGIGTYLGDPTSAYDQRYRDAIIRAVELGVNVIDTAVNYRHQRSERAVGQALAALFSTEACRRDEVAIATKGGFLSYDGEEPDDPAAYFEEAFIRRGLFEPDQVAAGCHVMTPKFLTHQIDVSRRNLGLETLDLYYLHNPETQLQEAAYEEFLRRLRLALEGLEQAVTDGKIRRYGLATWNALRTKQNEKESIALGDVWRLAEEVGGRNHHFRALQLPFSIAMPQALVAPTQEKNGRLVTLLEAARDYGLMVFASASLLQGHLSRGLPEGVQKWFPTLHRDAQRAIQFTRSAPGVTCALVGMSWREHVEENLATALVAPLSPTEFARLLSAQI